MERDELIKRLKNCVAYEEDICAMDCDNCPYNRDEDGTIRGHHTCMAALMRDVINYLEDNNA